MLKTAFHPRQDDVREAFDAEVERDGFLTREPFIALAQPYQFGSALTKEADFLFHRGGTFDLGEAKWTEHPSQRDADALLRVAGELPRGRVRLCTIICRCPNPYPLATGVQAISLDGLDELLG